MAVKPKLALIPSGVKASKVYSVLPSDGVGDFDFSRSGSATRINKDGLIETVSSNVPRLNYPLIDGVVSGCPSLLLEPSRTNIIPYSEDFSQSTWSKIGLATITSNSIISPDNTQNADLLVSANATSAQGIQEELSFVNGSDYVISIFAKKKDYNFLRINLGGFNSVFNGSSVWFDLENGVLGTIQTGIEASIEDFGNGWYRCTAIQSASATANGRVNYFLGSSDNDNNTIGDGSKGNYIWGAQLEQGSYATSYIPTQGSIGTRVAESCSDAGNEQVFNNLEGVLYIEADILKTSGTGFLVSISNGLSLSESINIRQQSSGTLSFQLSSAGSNTFVTTTDWSEGINKIALRYNSNGINVYINGNSKGTNSAITYPNMNNLDLASRPDQVGQLIEKLKVKDVRVYNTSLTDSELQTLTTI